MKRLFILVTIQLFGLSGIISCNKVVDDKESSVEIWRTELIVMNSATKNWTDSLKDRSQYLLLHSNGKAEVIDSLHEGKVRKTETSWEIQERNGMKTFLLGFGKEPDVVRGTAYPIIIKNETDFKMAFDSLDEHHIWNLEKL